MEEEFDGVAEKVRDVILPSYVKTSTKQAMSGSSNSAYGKDDHIEQLLKDIMPKVLLNGDKNDVSCWKLCFDYPRSQMIKYSTWRRASYI